jgi:plastocyanin
MALQQTGKPAEQTPRLTLPLLGLMLVAALATFGAAYGVAGLFGRDADQKASDAHAVAAADPAGTPDLALEAKSVAFSTDTITLTANQPAVIRLDNEDAGIFHNIAVYRDAQAGDLVARGQLFDGPHTKDYRFPALPAGTYHFQCDLHPVMKGTLVVQ